MKRPYLVQNCAAKLIFNQRKHDHVTPLMKQLHCLPVKYRIMFKILAIAFIAFTGLAPSYVIDLLERYSPSRCLRASNKLLLKVPGFNTVTYGDRENTSFYCHGLPSLKMGLASFFSFSFTGLPWATQAENGIGFYWVAMGYPVLKWVFFFPVFSKEKLHFLRNIAYIRLNNDAAAV